MGMGTQETPEFTRIVELFQDSGLKGKNAVELAERMSNIASQNTIAQFGSELRAGLEGASRGVDGAERIAGDTELQVQRADLDDWICNGCHFCRHFVQQHRLMCPRGAQNWLRINDASEPYRAPSLCGFRIFSTNLEAGCNIGGTMSYSRLYCVICPAV